LSFAAGGHRLLRVHGVKTLGVSGEARGNKGEVLLPKDENALRRERKPLRGVSGRRVWRPIQERKFHPNGKGGVTSYIFEGERKKWFEEKKGEGLFTGGKLHKVGQNLSKGKKLFFQCLSRGTLTNLPTAPEKKKRLYRSLETGRSHNGSNHNNGRKKGVLSYLPEEKVTKACTERKD